ncbi:hypothetical protein [Streptomyces niveus]|uniref:hypothetical protein n=1 Tax=Streptomyces niveus TaxID=193462 RepID=UPI00344FF1F8
MALTVSLTACGGGEDGGKDDSGNTSSSAPPADEPKDDGGNTVPDTSQTLATINGSDGFQFVVNTAARDKGGFLTVMGSIKNTTTDVKTIDLLWSGQESAVKRTGPSLGGITLIDKAEKKRYYVLRDTDGYPLTTTGLSSVEAGKSVSFFAQFPAPPDGTSEVDIQIPSMPVATIEIS